MKVQLNLLKLVYPPVSNQEAEWLRESDEKELKAIFRESNLYMVGQRAEATFSEYTADEEKWTASAVFNVPGQTPSPFRVRFDLKRAEGFDLKRAEGEEVDVELGPKLIKASTFDARDRMDRVLDWFTTEKVLYNRWRGNPNVEGLDNYRAFATYQLLYVGISKEEDSFTRLVQKPHEKRVRILSNESPLATGARLTDEIVHFFFRVEPFQFHIVDKLDELPVSNPLASQKIKLIADAEKAFISLLQSKYNHIQYKNYPAGIDGLADEGLDRYGYIIDEDVTFRTEAARFRGCHRAIANSVGGFDMIRVEGDKAEIVSWDEVK